ncbi:MAG: MFS transporter [Acidimicrobiales bacterium]|nr:MFS transporter [Acidimicrobiales bacterium]
MRRSTSGLPWVLLIATGLLVVGAGLQSALLGVRAVAEGFDPLVVGVLAAAYFAGFSVGALRAPAWIRRVGHIRAFAALASTASVIVLVHALAVHPVLWVGGRFASGICVGGLLVVVESWLTTVSTNENRGVVLAAYMIVTTAAYAGGQLLLATAPAKEFTLFAIVSAVISLSLLPVLMQTGPEPRIEEATPLPIRTLIAGSPVGAITAVAGGAAWGIIAGLGAPWAAGLGVSSKRATVIAAALVAGGLVSQWPIGKISDRVDRRSLVAVVAALLVGAAVWLATSTSAPFPILVLAAAAVGAAGLPLYSLAISVMTERLPTDQLVPASATIMLLSSAGSAAGPLIAAEATRASTANGLPVTVAAVAAVTAVATAIVTWRRSDQPRREVQLPTLPPRTAVAAARMTGLVRRRPSSRPPPGV